MPKAQSPHGFHAWLVEEWKAGVCNPRQFACMVLLSASGLHGSPHQSLNRSKEQLKNQTPPPQIPGWCCLMYFQLADPRGVNKAHTQKVFQANS